MTELNVDFQTIANNVMPDLDYEIEEFQYYTWQITGWSDLGQRTTSPEFEVGNWKWRILLFPSGNNNTDCVSIYLDFVDLEEVADDWYCCVQFALYMWNPYDPTTYVTHSAHHRFTAEEPDWGFTRFYDLKKLFVPTNRRRPLIEHYDACNITALVRIIKDSTGVLWRDLTNYDSKKETGYVGLKEQGSTSYLNAELQLLYSIKYFRKAIYQIFTEDDEPNKSIPLAMQRIFYQLQISETPVKETELTKSLGLDSVDGYMQYDVQEFDRMLLDCLENKMKDARKGIIFESFPPVLRIKLTRFEYDAQSDTTVKINDRYEYPMEIDLQGYLSSDSDKSKSYNYFLHGCVN